LGQVVQDAKAGLVQKISVSGTNLTVTYLPQATAPPVVKSSHIGPKSHIDELLLSQHVELFRTDAAAGVPAVDLEYTSSGSGAWLGLLLSLLPFALIGLFLFLIMRRASGANSQAMGFGKSRARLFTGSTVTVTFADVAGVDEAKEELAEVVEFLKYPEKFAALGARIPRGVLLVGSPGMGKTLLARAVAGEAGVPFLSISGSEFVEMFVGVGASRVRDLFAQAKKTSPCIVFVDEIDAVGRQRGAGLGGGSDEREQTLNQILVEMDGFDTSTNVIVIAATNRPDILDPALLRPGRFDRTVILDAPDVKGREAILNVHSKGKPLDADVQLGTLAKSTPGFSGADLANVVNEAAILAARRNKKIITMNEFEEAVDRVIAGPERKSRVMTAHEKKLTAYHEGGHAVVGHFMEHHDRPYKITIISRGMAGGFTRFLPDEESHYRTPSMFRDQLCAALGGMAAEELVMGEASTGPSNDIEQVTNIARAMVTRWGMSERLGPGTFGRSAGLVFLGHEISETRNYSEKTAEEIDEEVNRLIEDAGERARIILREHRDVLDKLANTLLDVETLAGDDLTQLLNGGPYTSPDAADHG
jgi:cell division protease FtsH